MNNNTDESPFENFATISTDIKIAKKRYRIFAFFIDSLVFWLIATILGIFFGEPLENEIGFHFTGFSALIVLILPFLIWPISESIWGQTIGKLLFDLKVVNENFQPITIGQALSRFVLGFIDMILLIGLLIAANDKRNRRIGDIFAETLVISTKK